MNFQQVRHPIDYVIQRVRTGRLALPDFQRDFVWSPSQVVELLDSVSRQWPIGSLLLLSGPQPFAFRPIDNAPPTNNKNLDLYILDGQQRVTALYHAVADVSKYCYYINFRELATSDADAIKWQLRSRFEKDYPSVAARAQQGLALVKDIWDHPAFFSWLNEIRSEKVREEYVQLREERLTGLQSKVYQIMAIELEQGIDLEALARIFETINRTGIALNAFDLLVAKLYPTKFNLRDEWEKAKDESWALGRYDPSELEVLKLISLLIRHFEGKRYSKGVRQGDLLALDPSLIIKYWPSAIELYSKSLILCNQFGVSTPDLMPNWSMALGVAGCILNSSADPEGWWKSRLVRQTFAQAANTKIVAEFDSKMSTSGTPEDDSATITELLGRAARANGLFTRGLLGLFVARGAIDPLSGEALTGVEKIVLRTLENDGEVRKLVSEDPIGRVIAVSEAASKRMRKGTNLSSLPYGLKAADTQGFDIKTLTRPPGVVEALFGGLSS